MSLAVALHVIVGDAIGDPLIAESLHQPVENTGRVVTFNGGGQTVAAAPAMVGKKFRIACQTADPMHEIDGVIGIGAPKFLVACRSF